MSLDSVIVLTFLRIKCPVSTSFSSNVDLVTCYHSFSSLFAPLIVRLCKSEELCRIKDCVPADPARSAAFSCRLYLGTPIFIAPVAEATSVAIDNTCILCKSWPPEQWDLFAKKKSYAHSKSRCGRSKSMSASPAPSVAGTSDVRLSVPPASPPPSWDQVVMGGQTSAGVTISCHGSAPSGSVTMATSDISDDVVPASSDLPPTSGGEGGQKKHFSPACSPIPHLSSTRPLSPVRREKRLDPSGSSLTGPPPRSPSVERERRGRQRSERSLSPSSPSLYRSRSRSRELPFFRHPCLMMPCPRAALLPTTRL